MNPIGIESGARGHEGMPLNPTTFTLNECSRGEGQFGSGESEGPQTQPILTTMDLKKMHEEISKLEEKYNKTEEIILEMQKTICEMYVPVMTIIDPEACYYASGKHTMDDDNIYENEEADKQQQEEGQNFDDQQFQDEGQDFQNEDQDLPNGHQYADNGFPITDL